MLILPAIQKINPQNSLPYYPLIIGVDEEKNEQDQSLAVAVQEKVDGKEIVTVSVPAALPYSGIEVKIDTSDYIGAEGSCVKRNGKTVGYVGVSYYASRSLNIGGINLLKGPDRVIVSQTIIDLIGRKEVELQVEGGASLQLTMGQPPVINGVLVATTTFGCGSSVGKGFSPVLLPIVDECIMLDMGITGQMSEHHAALGAKPCGIRLIGKQSSPGRWMLPSGKGWGGTCVEDPVNVFASIDRNKAWPGLRILVMETKAEHAAYFELDEDYRPVEKPLPPKVEEVLNFMRSFCDPGNVNIMYIGGFGDDLFPRLPAPLCRAIRSAKIMLTAGGQQVYLYPGDSLVFSLDTAKLPAGCIRRTPDSSIVVPLEFTMTEETFACFGSFQKTVRPLKELLAKDSHITMG